MQLFQKKSPFYNLALFYILISLITRIVLLFHPITQTSFTIIDSIKIFALGLVSDAFVFLVASVLLWIYLLFLSNSKFDKPWGYIFFGGLVLLLLYAISGKSILHEYGGSLPEIGISFIALKTILFGLLLFLPKYRSKIRFALYSITIFIFVLVIVQNAVSEFFFWNEFGVRYNFIAVDYLVYTNTVIGNIMESYPVVPLFIGVGLVSLIATVIIIKKSSDYLEHLPKGIDKIKNFGLYAFLFVISLFVLPSVAKLQN